MYIQYVMCIFLNKRINFIKCILHRQFCLWFVRNIRDNTFNYGVILIINYIPSINNHNQKLKKSKVEYIYENIFKKNIEKIHEQSHIIAQSQGLTNRLSGRDYRAYLYKGSVVDRHSNRAGQGHFEVYKTEKRMLGPQNLENIQISKNE